MYIVHFPTAWWDFNLFYHLTNQTLDLTAWNGFENDFTFVKKFKFLTSSTGWVRYRDVGLYDVLNNKLWWNIRKFMKILHGPCLPLVWIFNKNEVYQPVTKIFIPLKLSWPTIQIPTQRLHVMMRSTGAKIKLRKVPYWDTLVDTDNAIYMKE